MWLLDELNCRISRMMETGYCTETYNLGHAEDARVTILTWFYMLSEVAS